MELLIYSLSSTTTLCIVSLATSSFLPWCLLFNATSFAYVKQTPTKTPFLDGSTSAMSTISFRLITLVPRRTTLQVSSALGLQSIIR
jgi:hypothetical protein